MADQPSPDRFKAEMPQIPGISSAAARRPGGNATVLRLVGGLLAVLIVLLLGARWVMRPKHVDPPVAEAPPQLEVPSPAPDPNTLLPHATDANPQIATVSEMAKPWTSKDFFFRDRFTGENVPSILVRLPGGSPAQPEGYWAFAMSSPYGNCQLEYITDLDKLTTEYGFRAAKHAMVGNPCSHTLFDPTKMTNLPGNVWVRGAIAQGSDLRPPLGIQLRIQGKDILAVRME
jgi:hypothetical protein